jgi:hypothetical protein
MNINTKLQERISRRLTETKTPCKFYKTVKNAEKVAEDLALKGAAYFDGRYQRQLAELSDVTPMRYIIVYIEEVQKYAIGFDMTELLSRPDVVGGYVGILAQENHYTF